MGRRKIEVRDVTMTRGGKEIGSGYDLLKALASVGLTQAQIASMLAFSERTLRNRLREDERAAEAYAAGRAEICYEIAYRHRSIALHGSERESRLACEFWLDRQFGWAEKRATTLDSGRQSGVLVVPAMLEDPDEWERLAVAQQAKAKLLARGQEAGEPVEEAEMVGSEEPVEGYSQTT